MDDNQLIKQKPTFVIIGSGLSALNLALEIQERIDAKECIIIEQSDGTSGASNAPLGLLNPCTSRSPKPITNAELYLENALKRYAKLVNPASHKKLLQAKGIFKPVPLGEDASKWKERYLKAEWPENWSEWVDADNVKELEGVEPEIAPMGGILIKQAWYVAMDELRKALEIQTQEAGVKFFFESSVEPDFRQKQISLSNQVISYDYLVYANGYQGMMDPIWSKWVQMHGIKGQMLCIKRDGSDPVAFEEYGITNSGYIGQLEPNLWAIGSTYEHHFEDLNIDESGKERILKKLKHLKPSLRQSKIDVQKQWSACRIATRDRQPLIGKHPVHKEVFIMNAMASKGLIFSPTAAKYLVDFFHTNDPKSLQNWDVSRYLSLD